MKVDYLAVMKQILDYVSPYVEKWLNECLLQPVVEKLSYGEAIAYFVNSRPKVPTVITGAMLLSQEEDIHVLTQVFLDKDNGLVCRSDGSPFGRIVKCKAVDDELLETFAGQALVLVE